MRGYANATSGSPCVSRRFFWTTAVLYTFKHCSTTFNSTRRRWRCSKSSMASSSALWSLETSRIFVSHPSKTPALELWDDGVSASRWRSRVDAAAATQQTRRAASRNCHSSLARRVDSLTAALVDGVSLRSHEDAIYQASSSSLFSALS